MYISLRNHSHYSLLKATPKVEELVLAAKEAGMKALALTDYSAMYGIIEFYKACKKYEIKPILGVEVSILHDGRKFQLVLLAKSNKGYENLIHISSLMMTKSPENPVFEEELYSHLCEDIVCLTGGDWGDLYTIIRGDKEGAVSRLKNYQKLFGKDNVFIEINTQSLEKNESKLLIALAKEADTRAVVTNNTHYLRPEDSPAHKVLFSIDGSREAEEMHKELFQNKNFSFLEEKDITPLLINNKELLNNTEYVSTLCSVELELGSWVFPNIEYEGSHEETLRKLAYAGIEVRGMEKEGAVISRLEYELKVIFDKGFAPYFLVVYDLLRFAREHNILTNIRGSVAGSLVTYLLQITKCNPFTYKLPFERFLNPERPSAPDIDMDYADTGRDKVIEYARTKYGTDNVGQIGTFGTMMARGAVRDVARAMKFPYVVGDRISRLIPLPKQGFPVTIGGALKDIPELKELYETDREAQIILDMAQRLEGSARHISVHAAGTVISPVPLWKYTPIQKDPRGGKIITQYDMYTIEDAGLLKFDFLGIRNLTILSDAINLVLEHYGKKVDIEEIPLDDEATFSLLSRGETIGLFQLNGTGMTRFLKELKPSTIFDINAMVALYRPGPLEMIPEYIKRKHDPSLVEFLDARLETILDQSFGVIVYQDDVMLIAIHLAGYSWLEADKLRKAMGKKIPAEMQAQKEKLLKGFVHNGLSVKKAEELWARIEPFAAYGFNKAHAASYGRVAYQTAYMKANFPYAYMTAILTNESGDTDKVAEIVMECLRMNIEVLPPDINSSIGGFSIVKEDGKEKIRCGLYTIKNLGIDISDAIIQERMARGTFTSFEDFIRRVNHKNLNKKSLEALAMCGAFDALVERNAVLENTDTILNFHKSIMQEKATAQASLFGDALEPKMVLPYKNKASLSEKLVWEKDLLGLYVSGFPLDPWKEKILARNISIASLLHGDQADSTSISLPVLIDSIKVTTTKKGDRMSLLKVRDYSSMFEVALFPKVYESYKSLCVPDTTIVLKGKVSTRNNEKTLLVDSIEPLVGKV